MVHIGYIIPCWSLPCDITKRVCRLTVYRSYCIVQIATTCHNGSSLQNMENVILWSLTAHQFVVWKSLLSSLQSSPFLHIVLGKDLSMKSQGCSWHRCLHIHVSSAPQWNTSDKSPLVVSLEQYPIHTTPPPFSPLPPSPSLQLHSPQSEWALDEMEQTELRGGNSMFSETILTGFHREGGGPWNFPTSSPCFPLQNYRLSNTVY